jgi:phosphatidylserine decarboxylase
MSDLLILIIPTAIVSFAVFLTLIIKARIRVRTLYIDNILIILVATALVVLLGRIFRINGIFYIILISFVVTLICIAALTIFRFYRNPQRYHKANANDILSPADGFVTYITRIESGDIPVSTKGGKEFRINELMKVSDVSTPCWLIGITMTLFDVHYIRSPIRGEVILNHYTKGRFLSLKNPNSELENERNTVVIKNDLHQVGVIEIASRRVRGIKNYIRKGQRVEMGERIGMITFGSQADVILPLQTQLYLKIGQWVYGGKTVIATLNHDL